MHSLSFLPTEVIIRCLTFLPYKDLVVCTGVSKQFRDIIDASATLEYILELGIAGLEDASDRVSSSKHGRNQHTTADLLRALREREHAWSTLSCTSSWTIPVGKRYIVWELCGPVFAGCYLRGSTPPLHGIAFNMIDVFDLSNRTAQGPMVSLTLDKSFYNFSIDPGQDLLVVVEEVPPLAYVQSTKPASRLTNPSNSLAWKLHIRSLSSGLPYNQVYPFACAESQSRDAKAKYHQHNYNTIYIPVAHENWLNENGYPGATDIQILGDVVLFAQRRGPSGSGGIAVANWKTTEIIYITYPSCGDWCCTLLSQNELLVASRSNYRRAPLIEYYTLSANFRSRTTSEKWDPPRVVFELPFINHSSSGPSVRGTWRPAYCYTQASFMPKSFSPFLSSSNPPLFFHPSNPQLIAIRFIDTTAGGLRSRKRSKIDMFIHVGHLRKHAYARQSVVLHEEVNPDRIALTPIPWNDWGPMTTRILSAVLPKCWQRNIRGYRVLLFGAGSNSPDNNGMSRGDMVLDFNSDLWDNSVDGVIWHSSNIILGEEDSEYYPRPFRKSDWAITTSLPYRQMRAPRSSPYLQGENLSGVSDYAMLGDDIVYTEMDRAEFGSLKAFRVLHFGD